MKSMQNVGSETVRSWSLKKMRSILEENIKTMLLGTDLC
jgi:hypothetical protein